MSLLDLASLVLAPTATKEGKVYSAIPDTGEGDMTFTRGSSATRVNSAGLIEKERANLLLQSNAFDTTWTNVNTSETGGQTGYDGSSDAWLLSKTSSSAYITQSVSNSNVQTFSVYAKEGDSDWIGLILIGGSNPRVYFDLSNGTSGELSGGAIGKDIQSVGNGWYRCSVTCNDNISSVRLYPAEGEGVVTGTTGNIYIQDAMLNEGLVAQSYIETTTTAVYEGITDDVPRVDYSGGGCPSLLLEPSATALNEQSEYYDTYWFKENTTISSNDTTSPEGVANASKINETASTTYFALSRALTISSGSNHTISVFAKADERNFLIIRTNLLGSNVNTTFNLSTGVVTYNAHTSASIESYSNGWYRCSITASSSSTSLTMAIVISNADVTSNVLPTYLGVAGSGLHIYGINVMASGYLQSYIPTYGTSTTRVQDSCSKTGISELIGQTEGTMFVEFDIDSNVNTEGYIIRIDESSFNDTIYIVRLANGNLSMTLRSGGSGIASYTASNISGHNKAAFGYKSGNFAFYLNGTQLATSTSTYTNGITYNEIRLGAFNASGLATMAGKIKQAIVFPTRLTNTELAELTKL